MKERKQRKSIQPQTILIASKMYQNTNVIDQDFQDDSSLDSSDLSDYRFELQLEEEKLLLKRQNDNFPYLSSYYDKHFYSRHPKIKFKDRQLVVQTSSSDYQSQDSKESSESEGTKFINYMNMDKTFQGYDVENAVQDFDMNQSKSFQDDDKQPGKFNSKLDSKIAQILKYSEKYINKSIKNKNLRHRNQFRPDSAPQRNSITQLQNQKKGQNFINFVNQNADFSGRPSSSTLNDKKNYEEYQEDNHDDNDKIAYENNDMISFKEIQQQKVNKNQNDNEGQIILQSGLLQQSQQNIKSSYALINKQILQHQTQSQDIQKEQQNQIDFDYASDIDKKNYQIENKLRKSIIPTQKQQNKASFVDIQQIEQSKSYSFLSSSEEENLEKIISTKQGRKRNTETKFISNTKFSNMNKQSRKRNSIPLKVEDAKQKRKSNLQLKIKETQDQRKMFITTIKCKNPISKIESIRRHLGYESDEDFQSINIIDSKTLHSKKNSVQFQQSENNKQLLFKGIEDEQQSQLKLNQEISLEQRKSISQVKKLSDSEFEIETNDRLHRLNNRAKTIPSTKEWQQQQKSNNNVNSIFDYSCTNSDNLTQNNSQKNKINNLKQNHAPIPSSLAKPLKINNPPQNPSHQPNDQNTANLKEKEQNKLHKEQNAQSQEDNDETKNNEQNDIFMRQNFEKMKIFKVYFPNNNIPFVLESYSKFQIKKILFNRNQFGSLNKNQQSLTPVSGNTMNPYGFINALKKRLVQKHRNSIMQ